MKKKTGWISEFKTFITRGNVIDMAVGVIVGGAFTAIINSLVKDVLMPVIGLLFAGISFGDLKHVITPAVGETPESAIYYGLFIQNIITFLLTALVVFFMVKMINKVRTMTEKKVEEAPAPEPVTPEDILLLREIKELLKK